MRMPISRAMAEACNGPAPPYTTIVKLPASRPRSVVTAFTADGYANVNLPSGTYRLTVATATAIYVDIVSTVTTL